MGVKDTMVLAVFIFCYFVLFHPGNGEENIVMEVDGPAYEHSVKTIKMKPTILPQGIAVNDTSENVSSQVGHMDEKCPNGSVPILRIPTTLAKTLKSSSKFKAEDIINSHLRDSITVGAAYVADVRMSTGEYYGSISELNVYGVPQTSENQLSSSAIWLINDGDGQRDQINSILAGWIVYPSLFGDTQTRLFTYWTADGYQEIGCFNLECQGFVQVHPAIPLGGVIYPVSTYNGIQYVIKILIFKNACGNIFDCIDIYKQPSLDHPVFKDHIIQMRPSSFPRGNSEEVMSRTFFSDIKFLNESCPVGTIPIMRPRIMEDSLLETSSSISMDSHQDNGVQPLSLYEAQLRMKSGSYYGAEADLNVYGLPQVSANQLSSNIIWILNDGDGTGPEEQVNSIMAGWMVNPSLYGDNNTHLFINWTVDGFQNTGCYDNLCPGFVQVSTEIPLGGIISPLSVYNGPQYAIRLLVFKDPTSGDWWVAFGKDQQVVGYWPKSLFNTLNDHATKVYFGGLVRSPIDKASPPMGSGHFAKEGLRSACYSADLSLVNGSNVYTRIHEDQIEFYNSGPGCYDTGYLMNMQQGTQGFLFGGPGGCAYMI